MTMKTHYLCCHAALASFLLLCSATVFAADEGESKSFGQSFKQLGLEIGHASRDVTRDIGHASRDATKEIGQATRDTSREIGHASRDAAKETQSWWQSLWGDD